MDNPDSATETGCRGLAAKRAPRSRSQPHNRFPLARGMLPRHFYPFHVNSIVGAGFDAVSLAAARIGAYEYRKIVVHDLERFRRSHFDAQSAAGALFEVYVRQPFVTASSHAFINFHFFPPHIVFIPPSLPPPAQVHYPCERSLIRRLRLLCPPLRLRPF